MDGESTDQFARRLSYSTYESLLPNATYLAYGDDDNIRHFAGHEALESLSWLVTDALVPIILGIASTALYDRFRDHGAEEPVDLRAETVTTCRAKLTVVLEHESELDELARDSAIEKAKMILVDRGWPEDDATTDAEKLTDELVLILKQP